MQLRFWRNWNGWCRLSVLYVLSSPDYNLTPLYDHISYSKKKRNWGIQEYSDINLNTLRKARQKAPRGNWHISLWVASVKWQQYSEIHFTFSGKAHLLLLAGVHCRPFSLKRDQISLLCVILGFILAYRNWQSKYQGCYSFNPKFCFQIFSTWMLLTPALQFSSIKKLSKMQHLMDQSLHRN